MKEEIIYDMILLGSLALIVH